MVVLGRGKLELPEDGGDVLLNGAVRDDERFGDRVIRASFGHQPQDFALTGRHTFERIGAPPAAEEPRYDLRVERGPPFGDPAHGVDEAVDVPDAILQEVAE